MVSDRIKIPYSVIENTSVIDALNGTNVNPDFITIPRSQIGTCLYKANHNGKWYIKLEWKGSDFLLVFATENAYNKAVEQIGYEGYEPPAP